MILLLVSFLGACGVTSSPSQSPPTACGTTAQDLRGTVVAFYTSTVGAIRVLPAVSDNPQLAGYPNAATAIVCYIDGQIPKGPPPPASGTIPPGFDRAVVVVVGQDSLFVTAGYRQNLPTTSP